MSEYRPTCILYRHAFGLYRGFGWKRTRARALQAGPDRARARVHIFFIFFFGGRWRCEGVEYAPSPLVPLSRACVFSYTVRASVVLVLLFLFLFCF